jgi:putative acetyltransferase
MIAGTMSEAAAIRPIRRSDDAAVASIIREVMTEFGAFGCGPVKMDPEVTAMFESYPSPAAAFFVVEQGGRVLGCGGMGPLAGGETDVCELRKMYFRPELRGAGMGARLLTEILDAARRAGYRMCYLETLEHMNHARQLYSRFGFQAIAARLGDTGHTVCNHWMILEL